METEKIYRYVLTCTEKARLHFHRDLFEDAEIVEDGWRVVINGEYHTCRSEPVVMELWHKLHVVMGSTKIIPDAQKLLAQYLLAKIEEGRRKLGRQKKIIERICVNDDLLFTVRCLNDGMLECEQADTARNIHSYRIYCSRNGVVDYQENMFESVVPTNYGWVSCDKKNVDKKHFKDVRCWYEGGDFIATFATEEYAPYAKEMLCKVVFNEVLREQSTIKTKFENIEKEMCR